MIKQSYYLVLLTFGILFNGFSQKNISINGFVKEKESGELLPGVNVFIENSTIGVSTNNYGFYSISLPSGKAVTIKYSYVGFSAVTKIIDTDKDLRLDIELLNQNELEELQVSAKTINERISDQVEMSKISVPIAQIKKIPAFLGEKDVLKVLQLMPGVQKGTEGQAGLYVRGGGPDQNLLILDDATIYNANHLFGFFSVFNGDALKSVELTKGGFPARYGGRLSSVIEMQMKEGNKTKLTGEGGIGIVSSRLTLEGPIAKGKSSFLISGRRTYIDALARPLIKRQIAKESNGTGSGSAGYYFYDLNAKVNYDLNTKNKLYLSGFMGKDKFSFDSKQETLNQEADLLWGNKTASLRWNHLFSQRLFLNTSLIYSNFDFGIENQLVEKDANQEVVSDFSLVYNSGIRNFSTKIDFDFFVTNNHTVKFGLQSIHHTFSPSAYILTGTEVSNPINIPTQKLYSFESGLYAEDNWQLGDKLKINYGLRISMFNAKNKTYLRPEPRLSVAYKVNTDLAAKFSYAAMNQYIHLLSNTGIGLPTDLWVPTTDRVAPQQSKQWAAGLAKDLPTSGYALTLEGYYKTMNNIISYKEGTSFLGLGNNGGFSDWQDNVTAGRGWSYGSEILLQKKTGRLSGWIGYTLSWTQWQFNELNFGEKFYPKYDRRHDASVVAIYELSDRISFSCVWVYGTGNALTLPIAAFSLPNIRPQVSSVANQFLSNRQFNDYGTRNSFRAEPYHRLDLALQISKKKKRHERTWEFGLFNAYNRRNPFFYQAIPDPDVTKNRTILQRISLIPIIPSISYNFKF